MDSEAEVSGHGQENGAFRAAVTILGGALGNVVDRVRFRAVTDFFDFYLGSAHWPAFNMADVFVVGGVGLILCSQVIPQVSKSRP